MARVISERAISINLALITVTWNCGFNILSTTESFKEIASFIQVLDSILKLVFLILHSSIGILCSIQKKMLKATTRRERSIKPRKKHATTFDVWAFSRQ